MFLLFETHLFYIIRERKNRRNKESIHDQIQMLFFTDLFYFLFSFFG